MVEEALARAQGESRVIGGNCRRRNLVRGQTHVHGRERGQKDGSDQCQAFNQLTSNLARNVDRARIARFPIVRMGLVRMYPE